MACSTRKSIHCFYFAETIGAQSYAGVKRYIKENADSMPQKDRSRGL
jgi:hypothetical protein